MCCLALRAGLLISSQKKGGQECCKPNNTRAVSDVVQKQRIRLSKLQCVDDNAPGDPEKGKAHEETKTGLLTEEDSHIVKEDNETDQATGTTECCLHKGIGMGRNHRGQH